MKTSTALAVFLPLGYWVVVIALVLNYLLTDEGMRQYHFGLPPTVRPMPDWARVPAYMKPVRVPGDGSIIAARWYDKDRLLLIARNGDAIRAVLYDTRTGTVERQKPLPVPKSYFAFRTECYKNGTLIYNGNYTVNKRVFWYQGRPFGEMQRLDEDGNTVLNKVSCRLGAKSAPPKDLPDHARVIAELPRADGYIYYRDEYRDGKRTGGSFWFRSRRTGARVKLEIYHGEDELPVREAIRINRWVGWKGAYRSWDFTYLDNKAQRYYMVWLHPDGRLERQGVPYFFSRIPFRGASPGLYPTRGGIVVGHWKNSGPWRFAANEGLYLVVDGKPYWMSYFFGDPTGPVSPAHLREPRVSPDGCKVVTYDPVLTIQNAQNRPDKTYIRVFDACRIAAAVRKARAAGKSFPLHQGIPDVSRLTVE